MSPANVSLINSVILIAVGLMGFFGSEAPSPTAFFPVVFGVILLACNSGVRKKNKAIAHIAVVATLLILLGLIMPLIGSIRRSDTAAIVRVTLMIVSTIFALVIFIRSFIEARRSRVDESASGGVAGESSSN
ncbi:MAG: hypothetical protein AAF802_13580 [Planctomycetota bacterium]